MLHSRLAKPLLTLVLNLDKDVDRLERAKSYIERYPDLKMERIRGVLASDLPNIVSRFLRPQKLGQAKSVLGVYLAHAKAWERVAAGEEWALILEDDFYFDDIAKLFEMKIPAKAELIFVNRRADPSRFGPPGEMDLSSGPLVSPLAVLYERICAANPPKWAPGGDGYLLSPQGARKLLRHTLSDGCAGHVDWRMFLYGLKKPDLDLLPEGHLMWLRVRNHGSYTPAVIHAFSLSPAAVGSGGMVSARRREAGYDGFSIDLERED